MRFNIGINCHFGKNVVIYPGTVIADGTRIDDNTVIGKEPRKAKRSSLEIRYLSPAVIGKNCFIGANTVIYAGCEISNDVMVADLVSVREHVFIGKETIIGRGVYLENNIKVGAFCKIEANAYITAHSIIEDHVFIAPGVLTSNDRFVGRSREKKFVGATIKRGARVGVGAIILPGITIGEDSLIAAGSVVTRDVPPRKIVMGIPARVVKDVPKEQLLENYHKEIKTVCR